MKIHYGPPKSLKVICDAVPLYPRDEFRSPTRSTVLMLSLLKDRLNLFRKIARQLGFPSKYDLHLEYMVPPPMGRGNASHTDVMLKSDNRLLAIEAKWTEPMYETVGHWMKARNEGNRRAVLDGWLMLLQKHTKQQLFADEFVPIVYQMVHRAASAATAKKPSLAYLLFEPSPGKGAATSDAILKELTNLWNLLGKPDDFPFYLVEIKATPESAFKRLDQLEKGADATAEAVCEALLGQEPLFSFALSRMQKVGAES